eukprot:149796_1
MNILLISTLVFVSNSYHLIDESLTWQDGNTRCNALGSTLATITSQQQQNEAIELCATSTVLGQPQGYVVGCFFGLNDLSSEGSYKFVDNTPLTYSFWASEQPNNINNEDCVRVNLHSNAVYGSWFDDPCSHQRPILCNTIPILHYINTSMTWYDAEKYCMDNYIYGHLASAHSASKNIAVHNKIFDQNAWIGGYQDEFGKWYWSDGMQYGYHNWGPNEPNDSGKCIQIGHHINNEWDDGICNIQYPFVCQDYPPNYKTYADCYDVWSQSSNPSALIGTFSDYTINDGSGILFRCAFVQYSSHKVFIGTLFEIFSLENGQRIGGDATFQCSFFEPCEANSNNLALGLAQQNYRWPKHRISSKIETFNDPYLLVTCNQNIVLDLDFLLMPFNTDIINIGSVGGGCYNVTFANIRGHSCVNKPANFWWDWGMPFHLDSHKNWCGNDSCNGWNSGAINAEDNFGLYESINNQFSCSQDSASTTDYWIGTIITTPAPTNSPTYPSLSPTNTPSHSPSLFPSISPSMIPTSPPSIYPTNAPSEAPTSYPSNSPSQPPSSAPTNAPSNVPTQAPSNTPSDSPSNAPSVSPSLFPTQPPSHTPSIAPSLSPTACIDLHPSDNTNDGVNELNVTVVTNNIDFMNNVSLLSMIIDASAVAAFTTDIIYLNDTKTQLICSGIVACFQSNIICSTQSNMSVCNILCSGYLSCSEATITANNVEHIQIICNGEESCKSTQVITQNVNSLVIIDCVTPQSCESADISLDLNTQNIISCYSLQSCDNIHIFTADYTDTILKLYSYSNNIIFDNGFGLNNKADNIDCITNSKFIRYDESLNNDENTIRSLIQNEYISNLFPCNNNVKIHCDQNITDTIDEFCTLSFSIHPILELQNIQPLPQCYWVSIRDLIKITCPGSCLLSPTKLPTFSPTASPTQITISPTSSPTFSPTISPSNSPSQPPTIAPTNHPSISPSSSPSQPPTYAPSNAPTLAPSTAPSITPSISPSVAPSGSPTSKPTNSPSYEPTLEPTMNPTYNPTAEPTFQPTTDPTFTPTNTPSLSPTTTPSDSPSFSPSNVPSYSPVNYPSNSPSQPPTNAPSTSPSISPSVSPSNNPSQPPTTSPSQPPTAAPTQSPSISPSISPSTSPTQPPTAIPSLNPSMSPSVPPTNFPTISPTTPPTNYPSNAPTNIPSYPPSIAPTISPSQSPSVSPTTPPTNNPTFSPTVAPTIPPTNNPTNNPTNSTIHPTLNPTNNPTNPTSNPTNNPSQHPTNNPTNNPTNSTIHPTLNPTNNPTNPTSNPTNNPSQHPTNNPTNNPTNSTIHPTLNPTNNPTNPTSNPTNNPSQH